MLDQLLGAIDAIDLTRAYIAVSLMASGMVVYVMNLTSWEHEDRADPTWLQWVRRFGYLVTASALLWSLDYMQRHSWQPWPPAILLIIGIMIGSTVRIVAIHLRIRREGSRRAVARKMSR